MKKILVTGTAGFIGFHLVNKLVQDKYEIIGLDVINNYYDVNLKYARLNEAGIQKEQIEYNKLIQSEKYSNYKFIKLDLTDRENLISLFDEQQFDYVINLAAQAGVRYSLENPYSYIDSNIVGFVNLLENCRHKKIKHLIYASSSSVYGLNTKQPFSTHDSVNHPISLYAASKKSNELMAHTYSYLFNLPTTGLRFFTVYGPWGRPDMALFLFTKAILEDKPIKVFNYGKMQRDFTYVDDIVKGISGLLNKIPEGNKKWDSNNPDQSSSPAPFKIYNIGNNAPVKLMDFIEAIEKKLGKKAKKNLMPLQLGDVPSTYADVDDLVQNIKYKPETTIEYGIDKFIDWYRRYYN
jgi:UDP-glucuronate 4-epimerase